MKYSDVVEIPAPLETVKQVSRQIFFATLIIITAYLPLFAFERAEGKLVGPRQRH